MNWGQYRILVFGVPGTPIFEVGEFVAERLDLDLYSLDRSVDDYFTDKIPSVGFDTGAAQLGSEKQHGRRDPASSGLGYTLAIPTEPVAPLTYDERAEVMRIPAGVFVSEIAEPVLLDWLAVGGVAIYLTADEEKAVSWLGKRRKCPSCGGFYHMDEALPVEPGYCDRCGTELVFRVEDWPKTIRKQFVVWHADFDKFREELAVVAPVKVLDVGEYADLDDLLVGMQRAIGEVLFK